jgi:hypothetical protein
MLLKVMPLIDETPMIAEHLLDGVWARAAQQPNDAGAALTAILKVIDGPTVSRTIRLAAAMMLEPHLLTFLLPVARAREWRRLVGQEAEPHSGNMVGFGPGSRLPQPYEDVPAPEAQPDRSGRIEGAAPPGCGASGRWRSPHSRYRIGEGSSVDLACLR